MSHIYPPTKLVKADLLRQKDPITINCVFKNGILKPAFGAKNTFAAAIRDINSVEMSRVGNGIFATKKTGTTCISSADDGVSLRENFTISSNHPFFFETYGGEKKGESVLVLDSKYIVMRSGVYSIKNFDALLSCGTMKCGRLFGSDRENGYMLRWSGAGGYNDWSEDSGELHLEPQAGEILNVFDFENQLIVIREYGITRMSVGGSPDGFKVIETIICPKITNYTAKILNGAIYFFTSDGFMKYTGGKIIKIDDPIALDARVVSKACSRDGRYYAACGRSAKYSSSGVYFYDSHEDVWQYINAPAYILGNDTESMIAYTNTAIYRIQKDFGATYTFDCGSFDFGTDKRKTIKRIDIESSGYMELELTSERNVVNYYGVSGRIRINMRGVNFRVRLRGYGTVTSAVMYAEVPQ